MRYLLDTNTCIAYLNGRAVGVRRRLQGLPPNEVALCSVVKAELLYGARKSTNPPTVLAKLRRFFTPFISLPFDDAAAQAYGTIRADLEQVGKPIGPNDLMIAAIALACGLTLVTHNTGEFQRVPGLTIEDWEATP
jgi:tRNA(fMet)-specific endonuclease VapC